MLHRGLAIAVILFASSVARADVGVGGFFGNPTGLDVKVGLGNRTGLDLLLGWDHGRYFGNGAGYGHLTYLVTPLVGHGDSVNVPLRLGIGVAVFDGSNRFGNDLDVGIRFPLEVGLKFRHAPLEIYGEIALLLVAFHQTDAYNRVDGQGGLGIRFYF